MHLFLSLLVLCTPSFTQGIAVFDANDVMLPGSNQPQEEMTNDVIYEAGTDVRYPRLIKRVEPEYPELARKHWIDDFVLLEAVVGKEGNIEDINVIQAPEKDYGFGEAALHAVEEWLFEPTIIKDKPVKVRIRFSVEFQLADYLKKENAKDGQQEQEEKIYDIDEYDIPQPEPVHRVEPEFPEKARKNKIPGAFIILEAVIDKEGYVSEVKVLTIVSLHYHDMLKARYGSDGDLREMVAGSPPFTEDTYDFGKAITEAFKQWRFKPSFYNGEAVSIRMLVDTRFEQFTVPM